MPPARISKTPKARIPSKVTSRMIPNRMDQSIPTGSGALTNRASARRCAQRLVNGPAAFEGHLEGCRHECRDMALVLAKPTIRQAPIRDNSRQGNSKKNKTTTTLKYTAASAQRHHTQPGPAARTDERRGR